ncbi:MAG: hypothetical protein NXI22_21725 [bacterium]|nr:hypothetical protein [bacterium]
MRPLLLAIGGLAFSLAIFAAGSFLVRSAQSPGKQSGNMVAHEQNATSPPRDLWRRTTRGWERADAWEQSQTRFYQPRLHPLLIGGLQLLVSAGVLMAFERTKPLRNKPTAVREFPRIYCGDNE